MPLTLHCVAHSEIGLVRKNNQDSGYASAHLLLVADGMGGAAAGDLASSVAVTRLRDLDQELSAEAERPVGEALLERLTQRLHEANELIADLAADDPGLEGMGTTVTAAAFDGTDFAVAHIGDSRMYRLREDSFVRVTHDHSWVQSLVDEGRLTPEEAATHPHRSLLLRVLNGAPQNDPDIGLIDAAAGDRLLLCSDGLCGLVDDVDLARMVAVPDREEALRQLVSAAHAAGGSDNITVVLADVVEEAPAEDGNPATAPATVPVTVGAAATAAIPQVSERTQEIPIDPAELDAVVLVDAEGNPIPEDVASQAQGADVHSHDIEVVPIPAHVPPQHLATTPQEDARYAPRPAPPPRRRALGMALSFLVALAVLAAAVLGTWAVWRNSYFVGADNGQVAIFRGFNANVGSWHLNKVVESQQIPVADLSPRFQQQVNDTITVQSLQAAHASTAELAANAEYCRSVRTKADSDAAAATEAARKAAEEARKAAASASPSARPPTPVATPTPVVPDYGEC
ncbi:protein phosphatase [Raineyella antarctica]|uniref:Protein phosphatase n=1 Tax=Raineyella antarctica TaxID=1577474 RepID=A0A1G6GEY9_9ACTN|nr:protein phosphatase 2C domain-containing protein [Raineyella antarctica]SDB80534.1 protein phosphatase [Raineyella antarctica]